MTLTHIRGLDKIDKALRLERRPDLLFRVLFDSSMEEKYKISSLETAMYQPKSNTATNSKRFLRPRPFGHKQKAKLYKALCLFIEDCTSLTIQEVTAKYGREPDKNDMADEGSVTRDIYHFKLATEGLGGEVARIHGFFDDQGYFKVRRLDWGHNYHSKK